jgi:hypothetical protein
MDVSDRKIWPRVNHQPTHPASPPSGAEAESWRPVVGYEGLYEVSDLGRVRSTYRPGTKGMRGGRLLGQVAGNYGYLQVALSRNNRKKIWRVHRLVGEAFLGPLPPGRQTRHGPGGKLDNRLVNLCYGTTRENERDRIRDGTFRYGTSTGESHGMCKLTAAAVAEIRQRHASGERQVDLAQTFQVTQANISRIIRGETWRS